MEKAEAIRQLDMVVLLLALCTPLLILISISIMNRRQRAALAQPQEYLTIARSTILANLFNMTATAIASVTSGASDTSETWACFGYILLTTNASAFVIFALIATADTSMHIHLLTQVFRFEPITFSDLAQRYNKQKIITARLPRLLSLGQLACDHGRLRLTGSSVLARARLLAVCRWLLNIPIRPPPVTRPQPRQNDPIATGKRTN